jgi:hypothetical protein
MRLTTIQIIAGLLAAIAFCLAFMTAGIALASGACMILGLVALAWLARSLIRRVLSGDRRRPA